MITAVQCAKQVFKYRSYRRRNIKFVTVTLRRRQGGAEGAIASPKMPKNTF